MNFWSHVVHTFLLSLLLVLPSCGDRKDIEIKIFNNNIILDNQPSITAIGTITPSSITENKEEIIQLNYDNTKVTATSCELSSLNNVSETTSCSCDVSGVCSVGVTSSEDYSGSASFNFMIKADSQFSNSALYEITINPQTRFVSTWRTSAPNESITLPIVSGYNYNFRVDWGDGSPVSSITDFSDSDKTHVYSLSGTYTVTISGIIEGWSFIDVSTSRNNIRTVEEMGDLGWVYLYGGFASAFLTKFQGGITKDVTNMDSMFFGNGSLTTIDVSTFDTSKVTTMVSMFSSMTAISTLNLSNFNTSNVVNMSAMFSGSSGITTLNLSNFDTSKVEDVVFMFANTSSLTTLNATGWDVSNVSSSAFFNLGASFTVICDQGGSPGTGSLFGLPCN